MLTCFQRTDAAAAVYTA